MSDYLSGFTDWSEAFVDWTDVSISELHGLMTGFVCAIKPPSVDEWKILLSELSFALPDDKALELLAEYGEDVSFALKDKDDAYEFTPLVPDDEHEIGERFIALKEWAGGFITGVGMADMHLGKDELEMLSDLSKIASFRFDVDDFESANASKGFGENDDEMGDDFDEFDSFDDEDDGEDPLELHYFELYEFARMVPVSLAMRQKKNFKDLALVKGLDPSRKTANELKETSLPPIIDAMHKH